MTLDDLLKLRRMKARPAYPIILTDLPDVHEWAVRHDWPAMHIPHLVDRPLDALHALHCVIVVEDIPTYRLIHDRLIQANVASLRAMSIFGFEDHIRRAHANHP
jgi:hypothetical protein